MTQKELEHAVRHMLAETSWVLIPPRKEKKMIKRLWEKLVAWVKGLPWKVMLAAMVLMTLVLLVLVQGTLVWTDWVVAYLFTAAVVVAVWKLAK